MVAAVAVVADAVLLLAVAVAVDQLLAAVAMVVVAALFTVVAMLMVAWAALFMAVVKWAAFTAETLVAFSKLLARFGFQTRCKSKFLTLLPVNVRFLSSTLTT